MLSPSLGILHWSRHLSSNKYCSLWPVLFSHLRSQSVSWPPCISPDTAATQMTGMSRRAKHKWKLNCLIPGSDHFIFGSKYTSRTERGSATLQKCFVSRDVKAVLLTRINIQPTFRRICQPLSGRGLSGATREQQETTCPCKRHMLSHPFKSYLVQRLI